MIILVAAIKAERKHKRVCLYLVENLRKKESVDLKIARGRVSKSSVGACKSYCMNFDSFKIVDSSLP